MEANLEHKATTDGYSIRVRVMNNGDENDGFARDGPFLPRPPMKAVRNTRVLQMVLCYTLCLVPSYFREGWVGQTPSRNIYSYDAPSTLGGLYPHMS
jgi:hypothetical protein